jgi:serine/threonine-protein kinase
MIGQLGKYRIDGVLGKGAMGVVYKAFDPLIERTVALKTIRKELFSDDQQAELIGRFKNEAMAAGRLNHPNIVTVYDYFDDSESACIAMEFVDGTPLDTLMVAGQPCALPRVAAWMGDLLLALDYAHSRGVVHRDIKPANLLVTTGAQVKVSDFGIARIESSTLTQVGAMVGTPSYMSPEQLRGDAIDGRSDVFSAGVLLYQLLTGERPFSGAPTVVMQQILNDEPVPPSARTPALGLAFDAVLARALAKEAQARYPTARAFLDALAGAMRGAGPDPDATRTVDDDRTALGVWRVPEPAAQGSLATGGLPGLGSAQWKTEALPELEPLLATHIGPMAKILLRKEAAGADGMDQLCEKLLPHIPTEAGRVHFQTGISQVKRKLAASGTSTGLARPATLSASVASAVVTAPARTAIRAPQPYDDAFVELCAQRLTVLIGPIARVVAKRAARQTSDRSEFLQLLAGHIETAAERTRFLAEA